MTDIEGSTRLVGLLGDAFHELLNGHFALLDKAVTGNGGTLVSSEGDSVFAVFPSAREANPAREHSPPISIRSRHATCWRAFGGRDHGSAISMCFRRAHG